MRTLRLRIHPTAEWKLRSGHPWLYADSVVEQNREGETGELAVIYDRHDNFLAIGLYDAESPLRVRVLHKGKPQPLNSQWWDQKIQQALSLRQGHFGPDTNGYRCIHGESDGLPGLVLDRYGGTCVVKVYTRAWLRWLNQVLDPIQSQLNPARLVLRLSRNLQEGLPPDSTWQDGQVLYGPPITDPVQFLESGLTFEAEVQRGQKTGFFLDQRENRRAVETLAKGRRVLNLFSFSGAFSVYAARGGAAETTDLDISAHALQSASRNFTLNRTFPTVAECRHQLVQADAFQWLSGHIEPRFDLVILDPPSLARREADHEAALSAYANLAHRSVLCLRSGGVLVAASCSAHVPADEFFELVRTTAKAGGRTCSELQRTYHPLDHPVNYREGNYLKCIYLQTM